MKYYQKKRKINYFDYKMKHDGKALIQIRNHHDLKLYTTLFYGKYYRVMACNVL